MSASRDDFGIVIRSALLQRGAKQKFSLLFLICLSALIFFLDSFPSKVMDKTRSILNDGIYLTSSVATSPIRGFSYLKERVTQHIFTYSENKVLKEELKKFKEKSFKDEYLSTENENLKKALESSQIALENNIEDNISAKVLLDKVLPHIDCNPLNQTMENAINDGDIFLSFNSTALIQAAFQGKKCFQLMNLPVECDNFEELGICKTFMDLNEFNVYLTNLLKSDKDKILSEGNSINDKYIETFKCGPGMRFTNLFTMQMRKTKIRKTSIKF